MTVAGVAAAGSDGGEWLRPWVQRAVEGEDLHGAASALPVEHLRRRQTAGVLRVTVRRCGAAAGRCGAGWLRTVRYCGFMPQILSNGVELGPTPRVDLAPGETRPVELDARGQTFTHYSVHVEIGSSAA